MKLPLTDKFLWEAYKFIENLDRASERIVPPRSMKELIYPEFFRLKRERERKLERKTFAKLVYYLKQRGWIKIANLENKKGIILTPQGVEKLLKIKAKIVEKKKRKDGKWQMIIFDIPEKKRHLRDLLRKYLHILGYQMLQKSIWISPYDILKETEEILKKYNLDPYVRLFLIEEI